MGMFILNFVAIILYIIALLAICYKQRYFSLSPKQMLILLGMLAISVHAIILYESLITPQGLNLGFFNAASLIAWVITVLLLLTLMREPVETLLAVLFPMAALTIGLEGYFHTERVIATNREFTVELHIIFSILAYSLLSISAFQAIFLAVQDYQLRNKHPARVMQILPPLQVMENLLFRMIALGVFWLSLSLISGFMFLENIFAQHLVHKTVLSIIAWWVFFILLWGRWHYGWRGRTAIRWNLTGFVVLMLAYFGSKLVLELILRR